jgi:hypothetical protein
MPITKIDLIIIVLALLIGTICGGYQYRNDILHSLSGENNPIVWEQLDIDKKVVENTTNIDAIMALNPPHADAPEEEWARFILQIKPIHPKNQRGHTNLSPMLAWYAYIAKHNPASLYSLINNNKLSNSIFTHLLRSGLLTHWQQSITHTDKILLNNLDAIASIALTQGLENARQQVIDGFFKQLVENGDNKVSNINIDILRFALMGMDAAQQQQAIDSLLAGRFKYDPRRIMRLSPIIDNESILLSLLQQQAYPSKSMSSYIQDGALWGAQEYIDTLISDVQDNAKQPMNFYCSVCGLALSSDGLLGQALIDASLQQSLHIQRNNEGIFVIESQMTSGQL